MRKRNERKCFCVARLPYANSVRGALKSADIAFLMLEKMENGTDNLPFFVCCLLRTCSKPIVSVNRLSNNVKRYLQTSVLLGFRCHT